MKNVTSLTHFLEPPVELSLTLTTAECQCFWVLNVHQHFLLLFFYYLCSMSAFISLKKKMTGSSHLNLPLNSIPTGVTLFHSKKEVLMARFAYRVEKGLQSKFLPWALRIREKTFPKQIWNTDFASLNFFLSSCICNSDSSGRYGPWTMLKNLPIAAEMHYNESHKNH